MLIYSKGITFAKLKRFLFKSTGLLKDGGIEGLRDGWIERLRDGWMEGSVY